jgi:putative spermidine/putrescine transport system permease protein
MTVATLGMAARPHAAFPYAIAIALLLPIVVINAVGFASPVLYLVQMSVNTFVSGGGIRPDITAENYAAILTDVFYLELLGRSVIFALTVTAITLILSYPIALFIHRARPHWRTFLTIMAISPLLLSAVIRTYGWILVLGDQGMINSALMALGIVKVPVRLANNLTGATIGLVEILMPYMILALQAGFGRLDQTYEEAARSLGATPRTNFVRIVLPLTMPGIALGTLLCFVLAISSFITPKLLGGGRVVLLATEIFDQAMMLLNWPLAAALSVLILTVFAAALALYGRVTQSLA